MGVAGLPAATLQTIANEIYSFYGASSFTWTMPAINYHSAGNAITVPGVVLGHGLLSSYGVTSNGGKGTISGAGTTTLTYTHTANDCSASTAIVYGHGATADSPGRTISIPTINPPALTTPDPAPTLTYSTNAQNITLGTANVSSVSINASPTNGTAAAVNANTISYASSATVYDPHPNIGYLAQGPTACGVSASQTVHVTVSAPPAPVVTDIGSAGSPIVVSAASPTTFNLVTLGKISGVVADSAGNVYAVSASQPTAGGSGTSGVSGNVITYTPSGATGATTITYTKAGPGGISNTATIYLNVTAVPTAAAKSATATYNTPLTIDLTSSISSGSAITSVTPTSPAHGTASANGTTTVLYTPTTGYFGTDTFNYTATSAVGTSTAATVTVTVNPPVPTVAGTTANVAYNTPTVINLASSIGPVGATVLSVAAPTATGGTAVPVGAGAPTSITFTPTNGLTGAASFTYTATNAGGTSAGSATVSITIQNPSAPVANARTVTAAASGSTLIDLSTSISGVYTSASLASAPAHGTATLSGTTVTYTPTAGYHGSDSFTYTATGLGGTSAPATVSISATPVTPAINRTTPVNTSLLIDLTTLTSGSIVSFGTSSPSHGTASVSGNVITYIPTANYIGADAFTYTANGGAAGNSTGSVSVTVTALSATAAGVNISVPLNSSATLDLAPFLGGTGITGVGIDSPAKNGTVQIAGTKATYTPKNNFFGTDTFTYVAFGSGGRSAPATVNVTITGRPDPGKDAAVVGVVGTQTQTAVQFSAAQVANFSRHMESLHRIGGSPAVRNSLAASQAPPMPAALTEPPSATQLPTGVGSAVASLPVSSAVSLAAGQLGLGASPLYGLTSGLLQNRSLNLGALSAALDGAGATASAVPGDKVWVEGVISFGQRDANGNVVASDFSSTGVSIGIDHPVSDKLIVGVGVGMAKDITNIGTDGSRSVAKGYSLSVYGSYQPGGNAFLEGMLGIGTFDFDMQRYVDPVADFALSTRKGTQIFGSVGGGFEWRKGPNMVSPYARLDFSNDRLDQTTETGAGSYALTYFEQNDASLQGVLGLRGESIHATGFGWAVPRARVEWRQDLKNGSDAAISYADQVGGTRYSIAGSGITQSALVLGLGSEFVFRDGWALGLDYQLTRASAQESSYALRLRLSKEFGVKGLPNLLQGIDSDFAGDDEITVDTGVTFDDNVTRAKLSNDIRSDTFYTLNVSKTYMRFLSANTRVLLTGVLGGERFQNFNGLSKISLGAEATYQYRSSAEFDAATWGVVGKVSGEDFQSNLRDGVRYSLGGTILQPLTDRITVFGALTRNLRQANSDVFSTKDTAVRVNLDYALRGGTTVYVSGEYRDGDLLSTGQQSLENITTADKFVQDDAFKGTPVFAYRLPGTTLLTTLGLNVGLGARDSIDLSWRRVESTPSGRPAWATSPSSYVTNQMLANYLMRF